jgi:hypothetical protein
VLSVQSLRLLVKSIEECNLSSKILRIFQQKRAVLEFQVHSILTSDFARGESFLFTLGFPYLVFML